LRFPSVSKFCHVDLFHFINMKAHYQMFHASKQACTENCVLLQIRMFVQRYL
jgi:hypothetical protein